MNYMNNILALLTVFAGGVIFYFIFKNLFSELINEKVLQKKDGVFLGITTLLVFIVYIFLETLHH